MTVTTWWQIGKICEFCTSRHKYRFLSRQRRYRTGTEVGVYRKHSEVCISVVTEAEIRYGLAKRNVGHDRRVAIESFFEMFQLLHWNRLAARAYSDLRIMNERAGRPIADMDLMIAAHARAENATLITRDAAVAAMLGVEVIRW